MAKRKHTPRREGGRTKRRRSLAQFLHEAVQLKREFERDAQQQAKA